MVTIHIRMKVAHRWIIHNPIVTAEKWDEGDRQNRETISWETLLRRGHNLPIPKTNFKPSKQHEMQWVPSKHDSVGTSPNPPQQHPHESPLPAPLRLTTTNASSVVTTQLVKHHERRLNQTGALVLRAVRVPTARRAVCLQSGSIPRPDFILESRVLTACMPPRARIIFHQKWSKS